MVGYINVVKYGKVWQDYMLIWQDDMWKGMIIL